MNAMRFGDELNAGIYKALRRKRVSPRLMGANNYVPDDKATFVDGWRNGRLRVYVLANPQGITNIEAIPGMIAKDGKYDPYVEQFTLDFEPEAAFRLVRGIEEKLEKRGYKCLGNIILKP